MKQPPRRTLTGLRAAILGVALGFALVGLSDPQISTNHASVAYAAPSGPKYYGVNTSGGEFGGQYGVLNRDYLYPANVSTNRYYTARGQTLVRIPILWERMQPQAFGSLSAADVAGLRASMDAASAAGMQVILDLHNYGRYQNVPLLQNDAPKLADVWRKLAASFSSHPALFGYELMNEPHDMPQGWGTLAQAATDAIRQVDQAHYVLVPGDGWQNARFWNTTNSNLNVNDNTGRLIYTAHLYFDSDYTGVYQRGYDADGANADIGVERVQPFLNWLDQRQAQGMITEYGVPDNDPRWLTVLDRFMAAIDAHPRILGGTYWAAGPWWGSYSLSVDPEGGQYHPQWAVLERYPSRSGSALASTPTTVASPSPTAPPTKTPTVTPTAAPTQTPSPTPTSTPTATTTSGASYTSNATVSPAVVSPGGTVTITATVTSSQSQTALLDVEVIDARWNKVCQQWYDNQPLTAGQPRTVTVTCSVPASAVRGQYTVMIGLFSPGWAKNLHWNGGAGVITVQ